MLFWLIAAGMAVLTVALVARAGARPVAAGDERDLAVYKAQLAEVERDLARGVIGATEAEALRVEIKRRILEFDRGRMAPGGPERGASRGLAILTVALGVAGGAGLYVWMGAPGYADLPHSERIAASEERKAARPSQDEAEARAAAERPLPPPPDAQFAALMEELRAAVAERPGDVRGLRLLVENERKLGRLAEAARAQGQLVAALGPTATADDLAALSDLLVNAAGGVVTPEGEEAILATLKADPSNGTARFYAGLGSAQIGRPDLAFAFWKGLLEDSPPAAPWVPFIAQSLPEIAAAAGVDYAPPAPEAGQAEMIQGMVSGLEARLMEGGGSAEEWAQLVRALGVLGEVERAKVAWEKAQAALSEDAEGLALVRAEAEAAGIAP